MAGPSFPLILPLIACAALQSVSHPDAQVAALREMTRTVNAGDAAGYARLYAEDGGITIFGTGELRGRAAIEAHERELLRQFPGTRLAFYSVWQAGRDAVVHYAVNGQTRGGQTMGHEGLLVYRFGETGLIEAERRYLDGLTPMAQLGLMPGLLAVPPPKLPDDLRVYKDNGRASDVALAQAVIRALDSSDRAGLLARVSNDVVVHDLIFPTPFRGKREVQGWFDRWIATVSDARSEIASIRSIGDFVLVETVTRGTLNGDLAGIAAVNRPFTVHRAMIFQLTNGTISRLTLFMNRKELADNAGRTGAH